MPTVYPDGYFLSGRDEDFWSAFATDLDRHCDWEEPRTFARRVARWRSGAANRFAAFAELTTFLDEWI